MTTSRKSKTRPAKISEKETPDREKQDRFPIVGIGASAGGLEALELFLKHVPEGSGMAYVVVQHLDPTQKGIMVELMQRVTPMKVFQVKDRMRVEPNCVYSIPSNKDMSILHGVLHLLEPTAPRGLRLPIDFFLRSLAEDQQDRSIGVILSGMGSDGTLGLRAIKEKAGAIFVQEPSSAKFDSMPRSAIDAGLADIVAPVEELPGKIITFLQHTPHPISDDLILESKSRSALEKIVILLRMKTGQDFSLYKRNTIYRRIERRMGLHQLDKIAAYVRFLQGNPQELELLFRELLIGVTGFFRDPPAWEQMKDEVLPSLLANRPAGQPLRAWTPGCSTGEEAYSLAIVFKETLEKVKPAANASLQIFATDLDRDAIDRARAGVYPENIATDVSPERLQRFFVREERGYRVSNEIREMVIFAPQNLVMDPPFTKLDILTCRNLLIYLSPELQKKLMPLFHHSLNSGGILFLGSSESVGTSTDLFAPLSGKMRLYRRLGTGIRENPIEFPSTFAPSMPDSLEPPLPPSPAPNLQSLADQLLLQQYSPAAVVVNNKGDILHISGRTGKYLEPAAGRANWNVFAMAREGIRYELTDAFRKALRHDGPITLNGLKVEVNGGVQMVDLTVQAINEPVPMRGMLLVIFTDVPTPLETKTSRKTKQASTHETRLAELEKDIQQAREELRLTREEMQTSQEELKSTNEELQSTNEELQSTNEELTTSKEEMQSMNEELQTVNHELQSKVDELSRTNNDMKNLLNSTEIATLFLDGELCVRRFTTQASKIINLIPGDVGRPITDIASNLIYPELADDVYEVLRTLVFVEKQIAAADDRWFAVRIMPYRTLEDKIDGVVITFRDITASKTLEAAMQKTQAGLEQKVADQTAELEKTRCGLRTDADQLRRTRTDSGAAMKRDTT